MTCLSTGSAGSKCTGVVRIGSGRGPISRYGAERLPLRWQCYWGSSGPMKDWNDDDVKSGWGTYLEAGLVGLVVLLMLGSTICDLICN